MNGLMPDSKGKIRSNGRPRSSESRRIPKDMRDFVGSVLSIYDVVVEIPAAYVAK